MWLKFAFSRWCIAVFLELSLVLLSHVEGDPEKYTVNYPLGNVKFSSGSTTPATAIVQISHAAQGAKIIAVRIKFDYNSSLIQCRVDDGRTCHNVSVVEKATYLYLTAPVSKEPVVKDRKVNLVPSLLDWPDKVTKDAIELHNLTIIIMDSRSKCSM